MCSINRGAGPGVLSGMPSSIGGAPASGASNTTSNTLYGATQPAGGAAAAGRPVAGTGGTGSGGGRTGGYNTHLA